MSSLRSLAQVTGRLSRSAFRPPARGLASRHYVRVAGVAAYAGRDDVVHFMQRNGVDVSRIVAASERPLRGPLAADWAPQEPDYRKQPASRGADAAATEARTHDDALEEEQAKDVDAAAAVDDVDPAVEEPLVAELEDERAQGEESEQGEADPVEDLGASESDASTVPEEGAVAEASSAPLLAQAKYDAFINYAIWVYDAGSEAAAMDIAQKLSGRMCGMKLVRAAAIDGQVVEDMMGPRDVRTPGAPQKRRPRSRLQIIAPAPAERDRAALLIGIPPNLPARYLWAFFGTYDVVTVRHLRKERLASVVFRTPEEARRAVRERANLPLHENARIIVKMHS